MPDIDRKRLLLVCSKGHLAEKLLINFEKNLNLNVTYLSSDLDAFHNLENKNSYDLTIIYSSEFNEQELINYYSENGVTTPTFCIGIKINSPLKNLRFIPKGYHWLKLVRLVSQQLGIDVVTLAAKSLKETYFHVPLRSLEYFQLLPTNLYERNDDGTRFSVILKKDERLSNQLLATFLSKHVYIKKVDMTEYIWQLTNNIKLLQVNEEFKLQNNFEYMRDVIDIFHAFSLQARDRAPLNQLIDVATTLLFNLVGQKIPLSNQISKQITNEGIATQLHIQLVASIALEILNKINPGLGDSKIKTIMATAVIKDLFLIHNFQAVLVTDKDDVSEDDFSTADYESIRKHSLLAERFCKELHLPDEVCETIKFHHGIKSVKNSNKKFDDLSEATKAFIFAELFTSQIFLQHSESSTSIDLKDLVYQMRLEHFDVETIYYLDIMETILD